MRATLPSARTWPALIALVALAGPATAQNVSPSLRALSEVFRCEIVDRLARTSAGDSSTAKGRFITVFPKLRPSAYVQCIFIETDTAMYCEAASGAYDPRNAQGGLGAPPGNAKVLAELGYAAEVPGKNFGRRVPLGQGGSLGRVADLMLRTLHDGFGVALPVTLTIRAPHGQRSRNVPPVCEAPATS